MQSRPWTVAPVTSNEFERAVADKFARHAREIHCRTDVMFAILMQLQWIGAIVAAGLMPPASVAAESVRSNMLLASFGGGLLAALPTALAVLRPGRTSTRMTIAISQALFSSLLIHLTGGRIETHFHVFGSLAFLAAYRDWRVLLPTTFIVALDHLVRGIWWPESVIGLDGANQWRWLEHTAWIVFEDIFLWIIIRQSVREMHQLARHTAEIETAMTAAEESERRFRGSFDQAAVGMAHCSLDGRWLRVNETVSSILGYTREELLECRLGDLTHAEDLPGLEADIEQLLRGEMHHFTRKLRATHKDGHSLWAKLSMSVVRRNDEEPEYLNGVIEDVSEAKAAKQALRDAIDQAESANRTKSQFLANMSHEIRTPLNGILGFTEMLLRGEVGSEEEKLDYLRTIDASGKHLLMLINDVLDLSKIEAGQLQIERMACSPHQIIAEVISLLRVKAQDKGINLDYRWESQIPETVTTDPYRIKQLLMNLVGNAVKFTDRGQVLVVAKLLATNELSLEVRDTGPGIPGDKLTTIFDPFVQADNSVTRKHGGTGLGLAISRSIAEHLGGRLWASSEFGVGSTFSVIVDAGDLTGVKIMDQPPKCMAGDINKPNTDSVRLDGVRVLLVDDGDTNRRLLQILLGRRGAFVVTAENGQIAVDKATAQPFDIVLMDMQMPVLDGYAASAKLREGGFVQPIIALTAHAMKGDREKCEQAGCSGYLSKPIDMDKLLRVIVESIDQTPKFEADGPAEPAETSSSSASPAEAIHSLLPTDDPELRTIVADFIDTLHVRMEAMQAAGQGGEFSELAGMAHWLKGAGGTVGFDCFTKPAAQLEQAAKAGEHRQVVQSLAELQSLRQRVTV